MDGRTDLYGLGCVGYYLLTGMLVFEGQTAMQLVVRHLRAEPVPPSIRAGRKIPAGLERAIIHCLAKEPENRPAGALELLAELEASGAGDWTEADAREWWNRWEQRPAESTPDGGRHSAEGTRPVLQPAGFTSSRSRSSP